MADDLAHTPRDPLLLFDGDCAFCSWFVRWLERYPRAGLASAGWDARPYQQADLAALDRRAGGTGAITADRAAAELLWITPTGQVYAVAQAVARLLLRSGGAWAYAGALLTLPPLRPLADLAYRWTARNRYRLPGGTPACTRPTRRY